jgi:hypothetical protein
VRLGRRRGAALILLVAIALGAIIISARTSSPTDAGLLVAPNAPANCRATKLASGNSILELPGPDVVAGVRAIARPGVTEKEEETSNLINGVWSCTVGDKISSGRMTVYFKPTATYAEREQIAADLRRTGLFSSVVALR